MKKIQWREVKYGIKFNWMNYVVPNIPFWCIRKLFYRLVGVHIVNAHILMKVRTDGLSGITIEDCVCINEFCSLDGRGGLTIRDNASISTYSKIITGSHDLQSDKHEFISKPVEIGKNVFVGTGAIVLPGCVLGNRCVLAAGAVATEGRYEENVLYAGVPAKKIKNRGLNNDYDLSGWQPWFR